MDIAAITAAKHEIIVIFVPILIDLFTVKSILSYIYNIKSAVLRKPCRARQDPLSADFVSEVIIT